jgi:hydroxypyruvate isomerase
MLTRRVFGKLMAAAAVAPAGALSGAQTEQSETGQSGALTQFSVMMWTLNKFGNFEENLERVAQAGYGHVELVGEFDKWTEAETTRYLARMKALGLTVDTTSGLKAGFCDPAGGEAFLAGLKLFLPKVQQLGCGQIILLSGKTIDGAGPGVQHQASVETLKRAVELLEPAGITALIEPIDHLENPPIYLDGVTEGFEIVRAVGSPRVKVLYDLYHEQRTHGNLIEKLEKNIDQVGLVHIADVPGRHEPGTGEVNYINVYRKLKQLHYKGVIAMEFYPTGDVVETLRRAREEAMRS